MENQARSLYICLDGGSREHRLEAAPALAELGIPATFFLCVTRILDDPHGWKHVQELGHTFGNHFLDRVTDHGTLLNWNVEMVLEDFRHSQQFFQQFFSVTPTCVAVEGWSTECSDGDYGPGLLSLTPWLRSNRPGINHKPVEGELLSFDLMQCPSIEDWTEGWLVLRTRDWNPGVLETIKRLGDQPFATF